MTSGIAHTIRAAIPNILTTFRLLAVPAVAFLIYHRNMSIAFVLYTAASVSDWLDGYLARRWDVQTRYGQLTDPIADKALVIVTYLMMGLKGFLPLWLVALVLTRDVLLLMAGVIILYSKQPIALDPSFISKVNNFLQMTIIGWVFLLHMAENAGFFPGIFQGVMLILIYATAITTLWSGIGYGLRFEEHWQKK